MAAAAAGQSALAGCSSQPEGVDDDRLGVLLNYVCSAVLVGTTLRIFKRFGVTHGRSSMLTEAGMSVGYVLGGLCHGSFANRAHDDSCANTNFYPTFACSYLAMAGSAHAFLSFASERTMLPRAAFGVYASLALCSALIFGGASWCTLSVRKYDGNTDDCPTSQQATCDATMMAGEALFYAAWVATWVVVAMALQPILHDARERALNVSAAVALFFGPGQILVVCAVPLAYTPSVAAAAAEAMRVYCALRTGVTYILAVLASHLFTSALMERLLQRSLHARRMHAV
jgi:hypothetical protein